MLKNILIITVFISHSLNISLSIAAEVDEQERVCVAERYEQISKNCEVGEILFFTQKHEGYDQFSVFVAARFCSYNSHILLTSNTVSCILVAERSVKAP